MLKVLEKYKKYLLVVGGSLLMVAFIMPTAVTQMRGDPASRVLAYIDNVKYRARDDVQARHEFQAMQKIAGPWMSALRIRNELHWELLTREASNAGFVGAETDGEMFLTQQDMVVTMAQQFAQAHEGENWRMEWFNPQKRAQFIDEAQKALPAIARSIERDVGMTEKDFYTALAKLRGILRMVGAFEGAGRLSEARTMMAAQDVDAFYGVDSLVIPASRLIDRVPEPSEEDLKAHFEKYRDQRPDQSDNGLGYLQPNRVKVAYVLIDNMAITDAIKIDAVEANKRWRKLYPAKPAEEFAKDRAQIELGMRREKAESVMAQIDKTWRALVLAATRKLENDGPYKKLTPEWAKSRPTLEAISQGIVEGVKTTMDINIPRPPIAIKEASWLNARDVQNIPGFGRSIVTIANRQVALWQMLFTSRELLDAGMTNPPTGIPVQAGVPVAESFGMDQSGNRYYFMVLDAAKSAPPASMDEVKDQVVRGLKTMRAYDLLLKDLPTYEEQAKAEGLDPIVKLFEIPLTATDVQNIAPVEIEPNVLVSADRVGGGDPRLQVDEFKTEVLRRGHDIDPLKPVTDVPVQNRTFSMALPKSLSAVLAQIQAVEPLTYDKYRSVVERVVRDEQTKELEAAVPKAIENSPFEYEAMKARMRFKPIAGEWEEKTDDAAPAKAAG